MGIGLFGKPAAKLAAGPTLLLPTDPGSALLDAARRYDPQVRRWHGRLVFGNGVLLFGPVDLTQKLAQQAALPAGAAVAWYAAVAGRASTDKPLQRRSDQEKRTDGEWLVAGLAQRLGGTLHPGPRQQPRALVVSVYSEQPLGQDQVIELLRPYAGDLTAEDEREGAYTLTGKHAGFLTAYRPPAASVAAMGPPALGDLRTGPLHHWDLHAGVSPSHAGEELCVKVGTAALALSARVAGIAVDALGFRLSEPHELIVPGRES